MTVPAVSLARWQEAQKGEAEFWQSEDRTALCRQLDATYAKELQINEHTVAGLSVLDIGGGPYPIAQLLTLPVAHVTVVDPLPYADIQDPPNVTRIVQAAESYSGPVFDEVWGYNVLQHVIDPAAVLRTAKAHAGNMVRWFDWVETKIESHHPHSLQAEWIRAQFDDGWRVLTFTRGTMMVGRVQRFVALIAERI